MRTLRLSLVGTVILALLGGLGGVVAAQEEAATATYVTGTVISDPGWSSPESESFEGGVDQLLGMRVERQVEWSDARLPATMATDMNLAFYSSETGPTSAQTHLLDGPDGTWTATERGFTLPDGTLGRRASNCSVSTSSAPCAQTVMRKSTRST